MKTLASEAGVSRNGLYTTYSHLKEEFGERRERLRRAGEITDPRDAQITRLKEEIARLRTRIGDRDSTIAELTAMKTMALSRLAAQHEEIVRHRSQLGSQGNIRPLRRAQEQPRTEM
ncbi:hypothetical protein [Longispora fulva]|uniref:Chromosome segregation ATPase n=1 Tax=Longispora fulva TaxID=619741 RepID=A0A8J7G6R9_9ACTN|nr:hypothetical protein [Longispora fulva]MBG6133915.1 chromosome segregation ATPase [Longispora fulva]